MSPTAQAGGDPAQSTEGVQPAPLPIPEILAPGYTSENEKFLNTLHVFMEQHIGDNNMSIDDIAKVTCMSRSSLNRKMHELFNLTAKDFVQAARIKHACNLLRTTDMATKEVAYACGFSDPRYFSKSFKANTGKTPTEYKEEGRPSDSPLKGE
jgi:transcriptional regulator GlxA family with amidase domain